MGVIYSKTIKAPKGWDAVVVDVVRFYQPEADEPIFYDLQINGMPHDSPHPSIHVEQVDQIIAALRAAKVKIRVQTKKDSKVLRGILELRKTL